MLKRIAQFVIGVGVSYGAYKFTLLTYDLLADGQFFTTLLALSIGLVGWLFAILFVMESLE